MTRPPGGPGLRLTRAARGLPWLMVLAAAAAGGCRTRLLDLDFQGVAVAGDDMTSPAGVMDPCSQVQPGAPWPMSRGGAAHRGASPLPAVRSGRVRWSFATSDAVHSSFSEPVIDAAGVVYLAARDGGVYALDGLDGRKRWQLHLDDELRSTPALGADGMLYVVSTSGTLFAVDGAAGTVVWRAVHRGPNHGPFDSSPALGSDGLVYVATDEVCAIEGRSGTPRWCYSPRGGFTASPAVATDCTVIVATDSYLYSVDGRTGAPRWVTRLSEQADVAPVLGSDGSIYLGTSHGTLWAFDATDGAVRWAFPTGQQIRTTPAVGPDGTLYLGHGFAVHALDPATGTTRWSTQLDNPASSATLSGEGVLYVATGSGHLDALDARTGAVAWSDHPIADNTAAPAIGAGRRLYLWGTRGNLLALSD